MLAHIKFTDNTLNGILDIFLTFVGKPGGGIPLYIMLLIGLRSLIYLICLITGAVMFAQLISD